MNSLSRTQKPRAGFTLLEVMVVIVILGVLASLVVPNLLGNKEKADRQKAISDIVALENALDMYRLDNGRYPTTEQGLEALIQQPANMADSRNYRTGGYIKRLPKDPWGNGCPFLRPGYRHRLRCRNRCRCCYNPEVICGRRNMCWSCNVVA